MFFSFWERSFISIVSLYSFHYFLLGVSSRPASTVFPDSLSLFTPIIYRSWQVFQMLVSIHEISKWKYTPALANLRLLFILLDCIIIIRVFHGLSMYTAINSTHLCLLRTHVLHASLTLDNKILEEKFSCIICTDILELVAAKFVICSIFYQHVLTKNKNLCSLQYA